ncbi:MAG: dienelactone hydrolase family protein, partial [Burkholderiales bacterium]
FEDLHAGAAVLKARPECNGTIGAVGFCFGGLVVNQLAVRIPDLAAAVPFYGRQVSADNVAKIRAPLLIHYAEHDDGVNGGWRPFEAALKSNKVRYEMHMYPGTQHGFHNDTTPRYDEAAARLAWSRTLAFFKQHLKA